MYDNYTQTQKQTHKTTKYTNKIHTYIGVIALLLYIRGVSGVYNRCLEERKATNGTNRTSYISNKDLISLREDTKKCQYFIYVFS